MWWIVLAVVVVIVLWLVSVYNRLVTLRIRSEEAWSDIDVQLKRRYDLIPNLVETVKGYAKHEKELFEKVTEARTAAMGAKGMADKAKSENMLTESLKSVFAVAEGYPELKASENFSKLQDEVTDTEDKIEAARRFYNANVRDLNISIDTFPSSFVANMFKFVKKELFEASASEKEPVAVKF
ncbi:MAG: LemA family protein [Patescibacteria group bacterium]